MPFQVGSVAVHDDGQHTGSAKRNTTNGVAGLDSNGALLSLSSDIKAPRSVQNRIVLYDKTSDEWTFYVERIGATDYDLFVSEGGVAKQVQTESMKNAALGIVGLDTQLLISGAVISELNLLKIYRAAANFTQTLQGTGAITSNLAAGTLQCSCPANADKAIAVETDRIALSLLPRVAIFRMNTVTINVGTSLVMFGLADSGNTHRAVIYTDNGGTSWNFQTQAAASTVTVIAAPASGDVYTIYCTSSRVVLFKNGAFVAQHTTNIPTNAIGHDVRIENGVADGAGNLLTLGFMS